VTDSIVWGAKRRRDAGFPRLIVLVVDDDEKERIISERLSELTPNLVATLDIVSETNVQAVYQDVIKNLPPDNMMAEECKLFTPVLRLVNMDPARPSKFPYL
jgi:enoyl-[acyl-carrier-protein] reductase (NADH)